LAHRLQFEDWVPFTSPRVFAFFSNPENLPRIMPTATQTRLDQLHLVAPPAATGFLDVQRSAGVGSIIVTSFRLSPILPLRAQWVARITEFEWNHHFADVQQRGPFKRWHHLHEFVTDNRDGIDGTLVRDVIEYEVGFGPLGALGDKLLIARRICDTFAQRQKILPQLLSES
jgi:ligand-binding SRPBCC domain-containing protein